MPILEDGSCVPSFLPFSYSTERVSRANRILNDQMAIHTGYVVGVHYPEDEGRTGTKVITYDVVSPVADADGCQTWLPFFNLRWGAGFAGSAQDFFRYRPNIATGWKPGTALTAEQQKQASLVVFACENGRTQSGFILGFAEHPSLKADAKALGHYAEWSYNGVSQLIDKDGQWSLTFTGAILDEQSNAFIEAPEATTGTTIKLDKEGSLLLDNVKGESIKLDKAAKTITVKARAMATEVTEKDHTTTAKGKVTFLASGNAVFNGKKVYIGAEGSTEPLVLGNKLAQALASLVRMIATAPVIGKMGAAPVTISENLAGNLMGWVAQYGGQNSGFLSKKGYVE